MIQHDNTARTATILVAEDDAALNDAYTTILSSAGHTVLSAVNGREALDQYAGAVEPPQIVLLDLRMPVLDGLGFLSEFQAETHPETTVVVFSNYDALEEVDEAYKLGAERYVLKARAAPKELLRLVDSIIAEKQAEKQTKQ